MAELIKVSRALSRAVSQLEFGGPVTHVYNPLQYAKLPHELYLSRFGAGSKEVVFVGMNPGPFGMGQTGVPFGDVGFVRDWMGIEAPVDLDSVAVLVDQPAADLEVPTLGSKVQPPAVEPTRRDLRVSVSVDRQPTVLERKHPEPVVQRPFRSSQREGSLES